MSLSAVEMSSASETEELPSPFVNVSALICDHSYLPTRFGGLVENALVYISGFVVRQILRKLSCGVCRASLVTDAARASFDQSYHLLTLKKRRADDSFRRNSEGGQVSRAVYSTVSIGASRQCFRNKAVCPSRNWLR